MDVVASALAAAVAVTLAALLLARGLLRRRAHLLAWGSALALFAVGCLALLWGAWASWTAGVFRAYYLAGGVLCVPVLGLGTVWLLAPRLARGLTVVVVAFAVVATPVVLKAETRQNVAPDKVPEGKKLFDPPPRRFAEFGNIAGTLLVVGGTAAAVSRARRRRRRGESSPLDGRYVQANLLITAGVVVAAGGGLFLFLGDAASKSVPLALAAILIFCGYLRSSPLSIERRRRPVPDRGG